MINCCASNIDETQIQPDSQEEHGLDEDQITSDKLKIRMPTVRELNLLDDYISNEGNLPTQSSKCKECLELNCKIVLNTPVLILLSCLSWKR